MSFKRDRISHAAPVIVSSYLLRVVPRTAPV